MTTKEAVALLERYSNYDGMGIPNLAGCKEAMRVAVDALKEACPELNESEDERIRRTLVEYFGPKVQLDFVRGIPIQKIRDWLEKQKENPKTADSIPSDCVSDAKCEDRWYKVTDSLPDNGRLVLAKDCLGNVLLARYDGENWEVNVYDNEDHYCHNSISKWCEIPSEKQKEKPLTIESAYEKFVNSETLKEAKENKYIRAQLLWELMHNGIITEADYQYLTDDKRKPWTAEEYRIAYQKGFDMSEQLKQEEQKPEWSEDWREEDIQTRFAFYTYKNEEDDGVLYLSNVFVEEASRNHGFGTKILAAAEKVAETIGATTICLKVKQNSPANAWYRKNGYGYVAFEDGYDWLEKNLEYMKPQPKPEWSEEDEKSFNNALSGLKYAYEDLINHKSFESAEDVKNAFDWLKSLRLSWKPSEEQMEALNALNLHGDLSYVGQQNQLISLYQDLKKLM